MSLGGKNGNVRHWAAIRIWNECKRVIQKLASTECKQVNNKLDNVCHRKNTDFNLIGKVNYDKILKSLKT